MLILLFAFLSFGGEVRSVVFVVGDGMGVPVVSYTRERFGPLVLDQLPHIALILTSPLGGGVPDSASTMTAYMTGEKVRRGAVSYKGGELTTLLELAEKKGMCTGIVTNTRITHATPAATYAHVPDRDREEEIARFLVPSLHRHLGDGIEVILGGGREKTSGVLDLLSEEGYRVVFSLEEVPEDARKVIGLFSDDHMGFGTPLDLMVEKALRILSRCGRGFFLVVENGLIDIALHRRDLETAAREVLILDKVVRLLTKRLDLSKTLIVVVADHGHGVVLERFSDRATGNHTREDVILRAVGRGAGAFKGTLKNTDVFHILRDLIGF
ncbi:MAG: alkaline phosphatase [Aquificota bacterium]|nr:alkaline phosphatase [Aquificota bacterium]